jgi:hypothetical protein
MKRCFLALALFVSCLVLSAKATMVHVIDVIDARTIVVDDNGRHSTVVIAGVVLADGEAADAAAYLRQFVAGKWVLVETGGLVYRSPDGRSINDEMARHPWLGDRFVHLGPADPGYAGKTTATPKTSTAVTQQPAPRVRLRRRTTSTVSSSSTPASNATKGTTSWHVEANGSPSVPPP